MTAVKNNLQFSISFSFFIIIRNILIVTIVAAVFTPVRSNFTITSANAAKTTINGVRQRSAVDFTFTGKYLNRHTTAILRLLGIVQLLQLLEVSNSDCYICPKYFYSYNCHILANAASNLTAVGRCWCRQLSEVHTSINYYSQQNSKFGSLQTAISI